MNILTYIYLRAAVGPEGGGARAPKPPWDPLGRRWKKKRGWGLEEEDGSGSPLSSGVGFATVWGVCVSVQQGGFPKSLVLCRTKYGLWAIDLWTSNLLLWSEGSFKTNSGALLWVW
jgi:hypothetical protein